MHYFRRFTVVLFLALLPLTAFAATRTWDGGGADTNWSTAGNWSSDTLPVAGDTVLFDGTGKKDATVNGSFSGTVGDLQITSSYTGTVTVTRALTVHDVFLSGGTLAITNGSTVNVHGSWINEGATLTNGTGGTVLLTGSGTNYILKESGTFNNLFVDDGLQGYWRLDNRSGTGTTTPDSSRLGHPGTLIGFGSFSASGWDSKSPTLNYEDRGSIYASGLNSEVIALSGVSQDQRVTNAMWVFPTRKFCNLFIRGTQNNQNIRILEGDYFRAQVKFTDGHTTVLVPPNLTYNEWYHVALTYDGTAVRLYVNGEQVASEAYVGTLRYSGSDQTLYLLNAGSSGGCGYAGYMSEFRYYNRALAHSEIQSLYNGNQGTGSGKYTLASDLTVSGNLAVYSGNLDTSSSNYSITASGSFVNNANFVPNSSTLTLSGIGTALKVYGTSLYNLVITSAKSALLRAAATVTHALTIGSSSTFTFNGHTLTATSATFTNNGTLSQGTGALLNRNTSLSLSPSTGTIGVTITVTVTDADANTDGSARDTVTVSTDSETITLTETGNATGVFTGTIPTAHGTRVSGNGIVERDDACTFITGVVYVDPEDDADVASAIFTITDNQIATCNGSTAPSTSHGGGRRTQISTSDTMPTSSASSSTSSAFSTGNSMIDTRIQNLERRSTIAKTKLDGVVGPEHDRLQSVIHLIEFVIGRLRARM